MADLRLENVSKRFGAVEAVKELNVEIKDKEFFCILGPPGAGKTTTLRLIVGLERPDEGIVYIDDEPVNHLHPRKRDIAMIFQNLALYPDKTVFDNIAFPLRERNIPADEVKRQVTNVARTLHIEPLLDRKPGKLSGGERQRVAIGRAIVRRPRAYLLDEPLANLDALLRLEMRVELKHLQSDLGQTVVYVTHDQVEAMSMADRIAIMHRGRLQQCDKPMTIYNRPANRFVATIIGSPPMNFIEANIQKGADSVVIDHEVFALRANGGRHPLLQQGLLGGNERGRILVGVRPEDVSLLPERPADGEAFPARVSVVEPLGAETIVDIHIGSDDIISVSAPPTQQLAEGQAIWAQFDAAKIHLFDVSSEQRIYSSAPTERLNLSEAVEAGAGTRV